VSRTIVAIASSMMLALSACSDSGAGATTSSTGAAPTTVGTVGTDSAAAPPLRVDLIHDAAAAVEAQLGGPQSYYEINATPDLVNLFVAGEGGAVTAFVFVAGVLTSEELPGEAGGATFRAEALDFDPATVTSRVTSELPTSRQDVFEIVGGPGGTVQYSIVVTSAAGGQLIVQVARDGTVLSVDPV
jgi:hypothetical protein